MATGQADFNKALEIGRPPNVARIFPNSKALIVSGKIIDVSPIVLVEFR